MNITFGLGPSSSGKPFKYLDSEIKGNIDFHILPKKLNFTLSDINLQLDTTIGNLNFNNRNNIDLKLKV